jgi:hypothetical protein
MDDMDVVAFSNFLPLPHQNKNSAAIAVSITTTKPKIESTANVISPTS